MPKIFFHCHVHLHFSNSCVCVSKHVYAFPSSSILIHIYCHIHMYALCSALYLSPSFCFFSFFFYKINRHLGHGAYWCMHNPSHMPRLLPICIFICHLPNSHTLILTSKYTYIFQYILLPLLYEPLVPLCCLLHVNSCVCIYTCIRISLLFHIHTPWYLPPSSYVWFVFCSIRMSIFSFSFFWFYKSHRHLCHGAYWCMHNLLTCPTCFSICKFISLIYELTNKWIWLSAGKKIIIK